MQSNLVSVAEKTSRYGRNGYFQLKSPSLTYGPPEGYNGNDPENVKRKAIKLFKSLRNVAYHEGQKNRGSFPFVPPPPVTEHVSLHCKSM